MAKFNDTAIHEHTVSHSVVLKKERRITERLSKPVVIFQTAFYHNYQVTVTP